ncbi:MAG TPA: hypothetical protein DEH78_22910 [Solibacterales bacterium]|nr:hypothetical protein [Bryobacterales bacterium]
MDLHTAFDLYFADVAGYTVNVKAMRRKPRSELLQIRDRLSQSFFERYKQFDQHRASITPDLTPELYRHFVAVEENRLDLIRLIETLLQSGHEGGGRKD